MATYYKLIDAMSSSVSLNLPYNAKGKRVYKFYTLYPGTKYSEHADDPLFISALKDAHKRIPYTPAMEAALKRQGAKYEVVNCKVCGGRAKKIDVWLVEVVE